VRNRFEQVLVGSDLSTPQRTAVWRGLCYSEGLIPSRFFHLAALVSVSAALAAVSPLKAAQNNVLLDSMSEELTRNFNVLKQKADPPPYFLSYEVTESDYATINGTLGAIDSTNRAKKRTLDISVRVGSPQLDNYRRVSGGGRGAGSGRVTAGALLTFEDNPNSIRQRLWLETDRAYRAASERFIRIKTNSQVQVANRDASGDFSSEPPSVSVAQPYKLQFDRENWTERVRRLSVRFGNYPSVLNSRVMVVCQDETRYFVNTEGSRLVWGRGYARVLITASGKAADGTDVEQFETFEALEPDGLPDDKTLQAAIDRVAGDVVALLKAPETEPFVGPAIFSGKAAGVFFHEIF